MRTELAYTFLSKEEEQTLLRIARDSLELYVRERERLALDAFPLTLMLREAHGAFVTLRRGGELRGCIGYTQGEGSLAENVRDNAINAAVRDPRFSPVQPDELEHISIQVSALCPGEEPGNPFIRVDDLEDILIGRDGVYLAHAGVRGGGLLLPQVASDQGWDRDAFLSALCRKAGASDRAWQDPEAKLYRFSAQVFSE